MILILFNIRIAKNEKNDNKKKLQKNDFQIEFFLNTKIVFFNTFWILEFFLNTKIVFLNKFWILEFF